MTEREALKLALETLLHAYHEDEAHPKTLEAITAIKEALAQPEQEEKLPPVEIGVDVTDIGTTVVAFYRRPNAVMEMFYSQFHPLAQPEQEPVAHTLNCVCGAVWDIKADGGEEMVHTPNTTPPQRTEQEPVIDGNTSDGYHTFNELYEFRKAYNIALFNEWSSNGKCSVHKSWRHNDGELCFGGGWFIVVAVLPQGQISNHYEAKDWNLFQIQETEKALFEFDGHTGADVIDRLQSYTSPPQRTWVGAGDLENSNAYLTPPQPEPVIDKSAAKRIATALGWTPQRTWVGLTDEEIIDVLHPLVMADMSDEATDYEIARAIEAKLKERNQ